MSSPETKIRKLYYSISEVSEMTNLKQYVLRYWETEFPSLRPQKNRAGNRTYRQKDIDEIKKIKRLLYDEKYTIKGARRKLRLERGGKGALLPRSGTDESEQKYKNVLRTIKTELHEILDILNSNQ